MRDNGFLASVQGSVARLFVATFGVAGMTWALIVFPVFSSEMSIVSVANAVAVGEVFNPSILTAIDQKLENDSGWNVRSSILSKATIIRLRQAEEAIAARDPARIDQSLKSLAKILNAALAESPNDSFLWLTRFWLKNFVNGWRPDNMQNLKMSYDMGRNEGWIAIKRNRLAISYHLVMEPDLAELATAEFVNLVRWGFVREAAEIASGPGRSVRNTLFPRLKDLNIDRRRPFAQALYKQDLDDVLVPGIAPLSPQIPMPILPPGY